jgi:hypothetical protein
VRIEGLRPAGPRLGSDQRTGGHARRVGQCRVRGSRECDGVEREKGEGGREGELWERWRGSSNLWAVASEADRELRSRGEGAVNCDRDEEGATTAPAGHPQAANPPSGLARRGWPAATGERRGI